MVNRHRKIQVVPSDFGLMAVSSIFIKNFTMRMNQNQSLRKSLISQVKVNHWMIWTVRTDKCSVLRPANLYCKLLSVAMTIYTATKAGLRLLSGNYYM